MKVYGLTGGIGAGKSEAARAFARRGVPVIDADRIGHAVIAPGGAACEEVVRIFGAQILGADGAIDRNRLAAAAFADDAARRRLNAVTHPAIFAEIARRCAELAEQGVPAAIVEAALLGENGRVEPMFAGLILVTCPEEERLRRLVAQRGMDPAEARRRIAAQSDPEAKRGIAAWVVENTGNLEDLQTQVDAIVAAFHANGCSPATPET